MLCLGSFSHSTTSIRERPNLTNTKLCPLAELGGVCSSVSCPFAHNLSELRATPMLFRTVMCSWWQAGSCEFGSNCRFAHGESELRESSSGDTSPHVIDTPSSGLSNDALFQTVLGAALAATTKAASGLMSADQILSIASAAAFAAVDASRATPPEITLRKGFASSPEFNTFFDEDVSFTARQRADSDPVLKMNTDAFLEQLRQLWVEPPTPEFTGVPLTQTNPFLSASHMTLDSYQINND